MNSITPSELAGLGADVTIVDVRQPDEYAQARVAGARLIPLAEVPSRLDEIRQLEPVYVMCHAGGRSAQAAEYLMAQGVEATNVDGGITSWVAAGLPVERGAA
jgi:queuine tRNA-ribosyltransferase